MNYSLLKEDVLEQNETLEQSETILLLPHCLRLSSVCKAKTTDEGIICVGCSNDCHANLLRKEALASGYKGVCIAPGGSMAVKYVKDQKPQGIVAVACEKELAEGVDIVKKYYVDKNELEKLPEITIIPLSQEGCMETKVDLDSALQEIRDNR
jgi:uncharacterized protein